MRFASKVWEWTRRYGPSEIVGTVAALAGARLAFSHSHQEAVAAYGGSISEVIGFWGIMWLRDWRADAREAEDRAVPYGLAGTLRTARNLLIECGPAELLDTGLIRPLAMGVFAHYLDRDVGIMLGKLVGDIYLHPGHHDLRDPPVAAPQGHLGIDWAGRRKKVVPKDFY